MVNNTLWIIASGDSKMRAQTARMLALSVLIAIITCICPSTLGATIGPDFYYTWGINNNEVTIPEGSIITEAVLTINNITNTSDNSDDALYIHLLDNPTLGFVSTADNGDGDFFEDNGILLTPVYQDQTSGTQNLVYTFSDLNDADSLLWNIFGFILKSSGWIFRISVLLHGKTTTGS